MRNEECPVLGMLTQKDEAIGVSILRHDAVKKTYMVPDLSEEAAKGLFRKMIELCRNENRFVRGIFLGDRLIGWLNDTQCQGNAIELGWVIHPEHQNRGYATKAVRTAIAMLFEMGYERVIAGAFEDNPASIRVMEKSGMVRQLDMEDIEYRGKVHHCVYYAAVRGKGEWAWR